MGITHYGLLSALYILLIYTVSTKKEQSRIIFSIIYLGLMKFYKSLEDLFLQSIQDTTAVQLHFQQCLRLFILMTSCRTETETVGRIEKA